MTGFPALFQNLPISIHGEGLCRAGESDNEVVGTGGLLEGYVNLDIAPGRDRVYRCRNSFDV
jgi:hypothetical protein